MSEPIFLKVKDLIEQLQDEDRDALIAVARSTDENGDYALVRNIGWMNPAYMENKAGSQQGIILNNEIDSETVKEKELVKAIVLYGTT